VNIHVARDLDPDFRAGGAEALIKRASGKPVTNHENHIMQAARDLATDTVALIKLQDDGAPLASVALAITDQRMKIAFLEGVGELLRFTAPRLAAG